MRLFTLPRQAPVGSGNTYAGCMAYFYRSGTTSLAPVYQDSTLGVQHPSPVRASAAGVLPAIYLDDSVAYKVDVRSATGISLPGYPVDPINAVEGRNAITAAEQAAGITSINSDYEPGDSRRYDSLAQWAGVGGNLTLVGNYTLSAPVTFPAGTTIRGVGRPVVSMTSAGLRAFQCSNATGFCCEGVRFVGVSPSTVFSSTFGGYAADATGAITVTDSTDVRITDCEFASFYNGISVLNCDRAFIERNAVSDWYVYGIVASLCTDFVIERNVVTGCAQSGAANAYGIMATGNQAGGNTQKAGSISYNIIRDVPSWDGIMSHDCDGLRVVGNDIRNVRCGIDVGHSTAANVVQNVLITDNHLEATTTNTWGATAAFHAGIYVLGFDTTYRVKNVSVHNNVISGFYNLTGATTSGNSGHIVVGYADKATVSGNVIVGGASVPNAAAGIFIPANCSSIAVAGNVIDGTYSSGAIRVASATVAGLSLEGNQVRQATATDAAVAVSGSTITGFSRGGIATNSSTPYNEGTSTVTYAQRNSGATSVADGGTIAHGLGTTPTRVLVTTSTADEYAAVSALAATTFTVQLTKHDGSAGTTATVYWQAEV